MWTCYFYQWAWAKFPQFQSIGCPKTCPPWGWFQKGPTFSSCLISPWLFVDFLGVQTGHLQCLAQPGSRDPSSYQPKLLDSHVHRQKNTEGPLEHGCKSFAKLGGAPAACGPVWVQDPSRSPCRSSNKTLQPCFPSPWHGPSRGSGGHIGSQSFWQRGMALKFVHSLLHVFLFKVLYQVQADAGGGVEGGESVGCWLEQLHLCANSWEALRSGVGAFKTGGWTPSWLTKCSGAHSSSSPSGSFWWQPPRVCT